MSAGPPGVAGVRRISMRSTPRIAIGKIEYGRFGDASRLNPKLPPDAPLLLATLDIAWTPADPITLLRKLERSLLEFAPRFGRHECRGPSAYHVFRPGGADEPEPGAAAHRSTGAPQAVDPFDPLLALAHLIEHAVIEIQTTITVQARCSGFTAAHRQPATRFDVMVECGDPRVGRCSLGLALEWLTAVLAGRPLGAIEKEIMAGARFAYLHANGGLTQRRLAGAMSWSEREAARVLQALAEVGYLKEAQYSVNLSGIPEYRVPER